MKTTYTIAALLLTLAMVGCQQLPGNRDQQTTAAGAVAGAAAGALLADDDNQLMGALLGGAAGAGGGYLLGAKTDMFGEDQVDTATQAEQAIEDARQNPATAEEAMDANTADINGDGFVTMDELIAMEEAGFTDDQILQRLRATDVVFDLNQEQAQELMTAGLSTEVVNELESINRGERDQIIGRLEQ